MGKAQFAQPPENETDLKNWRKDIQNKIFGEENSGGKLDGDNITNITDPGDTTDVTDVGVRFNLLLAELRTLGIM